MSYINSKYTPEQLADKYLAVVEINNLINQHCLYNARCQQIEELERIWVKKAPNPSFSQNNGRFVGMDILRETYGRYETERKKAADRLMDQIRPETFGLSHRKRYGSDTLNEQTPNTPCIIIAEDGQSAKGTWDVFAEITVVTPEDGPVGMWGFGKVGVDFLLEDGEWKIWHMLVCTDFCTRAGRPFNPVDGMRICPGGLGIGYRPPVEETIYSLYHNERIPSNVPKIPTPYKTFDETFSY